MKHETIGVVMETRGTLALVKPMSHLNCDSGHCCQGDGVQKVVLEMNNETNASVGDKVIFEAKEVGMMTVAFMLFVMPLILAFLGAGVGYYLSGLFEINSNLAAITGGILFFVISLLIVKVFDRYISTNTSLRPVITKII